MQNASLHAASFSSRSFNQDAAGVKRAANAGPVFITNRGKPAHVLMTMALYRQLIGTSAKAEIPMKFATESGGFSLRSERNNQKAKPFADFPIETSAKAGVSISKNNSHSTSQSRPKKNHKTSLAEALACPQTAEIDFDPPEIEGLYHSADFS